MECKVTLITCQDECFSVLIETLWNVKMYAECKACGSSWSINRNIVECKVYILVFLLLSEYCINRNIVECKVERKIELLNRDAVLIETLWNVKTHIFHLSFLLEFRINRNIVECKAKRRCLFQGY